MRTLSTAKSEKEKKFVEQKYSFNTHEYIDHEQQLEHGE